MPARPNFLLIITDQQRADHLGAYGNPLLKTPHIDGLAAQGWRAENFFVASPVCMPNRATLLTGRMPSAHGARGNGIPLSLGATTFVDLLREAGYATALIGKGHIQNMTGKPAQWPPAGQRLAREACKTWPGRYDQEDFPRWRADPQYDVDLPFYGFSHVELTVEHGDDLEGHYRRWLRQAHPEIDRLVGRAQALPSPEIELSAFGQAWRTSVPEEYHPTAWIAARTIARIEACARANEPFFVQCSFPDPHHPFTPPGKYWDLYDPRDVPLPASFHANEPPPPHVAWFRAERDAGRALKHTPAPFACTEREAREAIALNYGSIAKIDDEVGRILGALKRLGLDRDTVVIFTSDHGDYMGDHQMLLKGPMHYRGIVRAPFIWHDPAGPKGGVGTALTQTIDIAPTILERARVAPFNGIQGRSLLPLMAGAATGWRQALVIEEEGQRGYGGFKTRMRARTLVTPHHRLSIYADTPWGELYDFTTDPEECVNLWERREDLRRDLLAELALATFDEADLSPSATGLA